MNMNKGMSSAITGAVIGTAMGAAAYMMTGSKHHKFNTKKMKKNAGKAVRAVGDFLGNVTDMVG